jgi:phosphohistidine phosphatase
MQRLILLRHGKAESATASGDDFERGLTDRGKRDAALMGRVLADRHLAPDLALISSARRARETWDEAAQAFPAARAKAQRGLYLATVEALEQAVAAARDEAGVLMIVGHNPGLHEFALGHSADAPAPVRLRIMEAYPTAAAAVFSVEAGGALVLRDLIHPRDHGGGVL